MTNASNRSDNVPIPIGTLLYFQGYIKISSGTLRVGRCYVLGSKGIACIRTHKGQCPFGPIHRQSSDLSLLGNAHYLSVEDSNLLFGPSVDHIEAGSALHPCIAEPSGASLKILWLGLLE